MSAYQKFKLGFKVDQTWQSKSILNGYRSTVDLFALINTTFLAAIKTQ